MTRPSNFIPHRVLHSAELNEAFDDKADLDPGTGLLRDDQLPAGIVRTADLSGMISDATLAAALASKADAADVADALAGKADAADVADAMSAKADQTAVDAALADKADLVAGTVPLAQLPYTAGTNITIIGGVIASTGGGGSTETYTPRPALSEFTQDGWRTGSSLVDGDADGPLTLINPIGSGLTVGILSIADSFGKDGGPSPGHDVHVIGRVRSLSPSSLARGGIGVGFIVPDGRIRGLLCGGNGAMSSIYGSPGAYGSAYLGWNAPVTATNGECYVRYSFVPSSWTMQYAYSIDKVHWNIIGAVGVNDWIPDPSGFAVFLVDQGGYGWAAGELITLEVIHDTTQTYDLGYGS